MTAERFPTQEKESHRFVTAYSSEELVNTVASHLLEALKRNGGFSYKSFGAGGVSFGGMNSEITIRGIKKGELILVNGCPVQSPAGQGYDLDMIPLDQVERIEIMKGASSTLYGADAMAGVINILINKTAKDTSAKISLEAGSEGFMDFGASVASSRINAGITYSRLVPASTVVIIIH